MIVGFSGMPGSGKTTRLARTALACLKEARLHHKKYGRYRITLLNMRLSPQLESEYVGYYKYYDDLSTLHTFRDSNLLIDEASIYFNSREWELMPMLTRRWLVLHRHQNVDIWFTTQDFLTVDNSFRRLTDELYYFRKLVSSKEPSRLKPNTKRPFSLAVSTLVPKKHYDLEKTQYGAENYSFFYFNRKDFALFDTHQDFKMDSETTEGYKDLKRVIRVCKEDGVKKVRYI